MIKTIEYTISFMYGKNIEKYTFLITELHNTIFFAP